MTQHKPWCMDVSLSRPIDRCTCDVTPEEQFAANGEQRCTASSWRAKTGDKYGPGGYNRCLWYGEHEEHKDGFGNVFVLEPKFRVIRRPV